MAKHTKYEFEKEIVKQMVDSGDWREGSDDKYDANRCLYPEALHEFIRATQFEEWEKLPSDIKLTKGECNQLYNILTYNLSSPELRVRRIIAKLEKQI